MLQEVQNREGKCVLLFFFVNLLNDTLLILDHDIDSHGDSRETEFGLEQGGRLARLLLRVTDQVAEDVVDDGEDELRLAGTDVLRRHHLEQFVDFATIYLIDGHPIETVDDSQAHIIVGHDEHFEKCIFTISCVEP
eukprot:CAMPEP_0170453582 /NCGR_PEP_ID=MMETSP0123-20130129/2116_1 /TAXON_ID=182087 /ORGANISM="Favella ehrenbergii, Strain Fehren 1" /LENGTH=135 /DNA_ID=CAMNT_0010716003 /DNA_START=3299 /DNA_END=3706 /DNA_ORIENTATION=-